MKEIFYQYLKNYNISTEKSFSLDQLLSSKHCLNLLSSLTQNNIFSAQNYEEIICIDRIHSDKYSKRIQN